MPVEDARGKTRKNTDEDDVAQEVRKLLLNGKPINSLKDNRPNSVTTNHVEAWMQSLNKQDKGQCRALNKHVNYAINMVEEVLR